jgi:DNA invertase Pin-like site-specific DNA recombinase
MADSMPFLEVIRGRIRSRGELHWNAKLTDADHAEILRLERNGLSYREIARRFEISQTHIIRICNEKNPP